jgi:hypothetical protein
MPTHYATTTKNDTSAPAAGGAVSFSHDSGSDSDRFLVVWVALRSSFGHTIDSATYNGDPMTALGAALDQNSCRMRGFIIIAPASGSNTVAVTFGAGGADGSTVITASTYYDDDQTTGYENYTTVQMVDVSSPFVMSVTVTSSTGDMVAAAASAAQIVTWTAGSGQTERADASRSTNGNISLTASDEAGAASVVMDHEATGAVQGVTMGISLIAAAAAAGGNHRPLLMQGVGA